MKKIDLHIHTNKSDGSLSPFEVIDEAKRNNVDTIAIADHDTVEAYTNELFEYANKNNINLITAVEISTKIKKCGIHILGYGINVNDEELKEKLKKIRYARHNYLRNVANKLNKLGYIVNVEKLDKINSVTKAHIALDIINNKQNENILLKNFKLIPNMGKFIETIMNENCQAYVKKETISPSEVAKIIRNAGGKVVLAHPVAYKYENNLSDRDILDIITNIQADGIESNYIYIDKNGKVIDEIEKWKSFAKTNNLFITAGSDFHIKDNKHPNIGLSNERIYLNSKDIEKMLKDLLNN